MPDPLTIPATWTVLPPTIALAADPLAKVSVVPIVSAAASHEQGPAVSAASTPARALSLGSGTPITPVELTKTSLASQPEMAGDLLHDLLDRLAPAIAGEGVAVAGVDDQRTALAALHLLAAEFDFGRAADIAREHAGDRGAGGELDIGEVAAIPILVMRARDAARHPGDFGEGRK